MQKKGFDIFFTADPVGTLPPVHGGCYDVDAACGIWMVADGAAGLLWRIGGGGSGQQRDPLSGCLLAESHPWWFSACPWGPEEVL